MRSHYIKIFSVDRNGDNPSNIKFVMTSSLYPNEKYDVPENVVLEGVFNAVEFVSEVLKYSIIRKFPVTGNMFKIEVEERHKLP